MALSSAGSNGWENFAAASKGICPEMIALNSVPNPKVNPATAPGRQKAANRKVPKASGITALPAAMATGRAMAEQWR